MEKEGRSLTLSQKSLLLYLTLIIIHQHICSEGFLKRHCNFKNQSLKKKKFEGGKAAETAEIV